jgi:hypothetical protein
MVQRLYNETWSPCSWNQKVPRLLKPGRSGKEDEKTKLERHALVFYCCITNSRRLRNLNSTSSFLIASTDEQSTWDPRVLQV